MNKLKKLFNYFTKAELSLWIFSVALILASFFVFKSKDVLTLIASLIGVTSLIFNAKGNPIGQALMLVFSVLYGIISFGFKYYGEMATYLGMTAPMALFSLITWLKNPFNGKKSEVKISRLSKKNMAFMLVSAVLVTLLFYFILKAFNTANLFFSTISVATSYFAVYLTFKRSPYFAAAYAANDIVLIILWTMAAFSDYSYISVIVCFAIFLFNDIYGFISWIKMEKIQHSVKNN